MKAKETRKFATYSQQMSIQIFLDEFRRSLKYKSFQQIGQNLSLKKSSSAKLELKRLMFP